MLGPLMELISATVSAPLLNSVPTPAKAAVVIFRYLLWYLKLDAVVMEVLLTATNSRTASINWPVSVCRKALLSFIAFVIVKAPLLL
jgi:hypothetical protein